MGSPALFQGVFVKFLKSKLNLFDSAFVLTGTENPTLTVTDAPKGSIFLQQGSDRGRVFYKIDDGPSTKWKLIPSVDTFSSGNDPASGFQMSYVDEFDTTPLDPDSSVDNTLTKAAYNGTLGLYRMSSDKTKTVTTTGTSYTFDSAPSFTVTTGDIIYYDGEFRRIIRVDSTTTGIIDLAFSPNLTTESVMISQAVWTKNLPTSVGDVVQKTRPVDIFPATDIEAVNVDYLDSLINLDDVPDFVDEARVVVAGSNYIETGVSNIEHTVQNSAQPVDNNLRRWAQTFPTPIKGQIVTSVEVGVSGFDGLETNNTYMELWETTGPVSPPAALTGPPAVLLATSNPVQIANMIPSLAVRTVWTFPEPVVLNPLKQYAWVFRVEGTFTQFQIAYVNDPGAYPSGRTWGSVNGGASWNSTGLAGMGNWRVNATFENLASNYFSSPFIRSQAPESIDDLPLLDNTAKTDLFLCFFPNPDNVDVTTAANLIRYRVSFYTEEIVKNGGVLDSAYGTSDNSGSPVSMTVSVFGGVTRISLLWPFIPGLNPGTTAGDLEVIVDGQVLPRFLTGVTLDAYYTEMSDKVIDLWDDISASAISIEVRRKQGTIDTADQNAVLLGGITFANVVTSSTTLSRASWRRVLANSTAGIFTVTLPAVPELGDRIEFQDPTASWFTNNITINRNGNNILGVAANDTLDVNYGWIMYEWFGGSTGWMVRT